MSDSHADRGSLYLPTDVQPPFGDIVVGARCLWRGAEAQHAVTVRRLNIGESVSISDGKGLLVAGVACEISGDTVRMDVTDVMAESSPRPTLTLVQALAKGDRDERAIEAATEIGVDRIVPWQAARSIVQWKGPKIAKGETKWQHIVLAATKQSLRASVPLVTPLADQTALALLLAHSLVIVLDPRGERHLVDADIVDAIRKASDVALVVGPEGGLSNAELDEFERRGAQLVLLGSNVLRTSTAGPAALAVTQAALGRWSTTASTNDLK